MLKDVMIGCTGYVTGFQKTRLNGIFYILRNTILKCSGSLMPNCRDAGFTALSRVVL